MYMPTLTVDNFLSPWGCVGGFFCTSVHTWVYRESMGTKPWLDSWLCVCVGVYAYSLTVDDFCCVGVSLSRGH